MFGIFKHTRDSNKGFSLIEMITVVAIFLIMTAIILANAPQFRDRVSIDLVANEVAIDVRTAQVYGSATKVSINPAFQQNVYPSFGIHFETNQNQFVLYSVATDSTSPNVNGGFDPSSPSVEETYLLPQGFIFSKLCTDVSCQVTTPQLDIMYRRPQLSSEFYTNDPTKACLDSDCQLAAVVIQSTKENKTKMVVIYKNGQISVQDEN